MIEIPFIGQIWVNEGIPLTGDFGEVGEVLELGRRQLERNPETINFRSYFIYLLYFVFFFLFPLHSFRTLATYNKFLDLVSFFFTSFLLFCSLDSFKNLYISSLCF